MNFFKFSNVLKKQSSRAAEQQSSRAAEQQSSRAAEQQKIPLIPPLQSKLRNFLGNKWF